MTDPTRLDHPPPRRLARPPARRRDAGGGGALYGAAVRPGDRDAEPRAAGDERRRRPRPIATRILAALPDGTRLHAADDLLPHRPGRAGRAGARLRGRASWPPPSSIPAHATTNSAHGVTDIAHPPPGARGDAADRHAAARPWRGDRSRGRRVRPRGGVHRAGAGGADRAISRRSRSCSSISPPPRRSAFVEGAGAERRRDGHAAASDHQPQRDVRRAGSGRTLIACRSPSASGTGWRCAAPRPRARPNSSSAPTARPHAVERKEAACGCAGIFNAPFALETYAEVFEEEGALDRLRGLRLGARPAFLRPAAQRGADHAGARAEHAGARRDASSVRRATSAACRFLAGEDRSQLAALGPGCAGLQAVRRAASGCARRSAYSRH